MEPTTQQDRKWLSWLIIVGLIVVSTLVGVELPNLPPPPEDGAERGITGFTGLEIIAPTDQPTATPAAIVDSYGVSALLEIRDASTPVARYTDGGTWDHITGITGLSFADETITVSDTLTAAYDVYALDSGGAVSVTLQACSNDGQILILVGDDANNVTIQDVNIRTGDGNALVLGQYDTAMLVCQDTEWIELLKLATQ
jgi:hypothetical protein